MIPSKLHLLFCCIALPALACHDSTDPVSVPGTYILTSINGHPLPAEISRTAGYIVDAVADTLVLGTTGQMTESGVGQVRGAVGAAGTAIGAKGTYTVHGDTVMFRPGAGDVLEPLVRYLVSGRGLTLDHPTYRALFTKR